MTHRPLALRLLAGLLMLASLAGPACAQGLLPATGADVRPGDLRKQFDRAYQRGPTIAADPGWTITPGVGIAIGWTDAVPRGAAARATGKRFTSDIYTMLTPSLTVSGNSARLQGTLNIAPQLRQYMHVTSQNTTATNFDGRGKVSLIPDELWVDLTGSSQTQSRAGGQGATNTLAKSDQLQTTSYSIAPTYQRRFGDIGIAEIGTSLRQSFTDQASGAAATTTVSPFAQPVSTRPNIGSTTHISFLSGEVLGRASLRAEALTSRNQGSGALNGAYRNTVNNEFGYKVTRVVALVGSLGWEDIHYGGTTKFNSKGATWSAGTRITPDPDSTFYLSYGRHDGGQSLTLDATYAVTARIRLAARYSEGISTGQEDFQNAIALSDLDASGQAVDRKTGIPISLNNNFFGAGSTNVARTKRGSLTATILLDRDVVSISIRQEDSTTIGGNLTGANAAAARGTSGLYGSLSVQRELSPGTSVSIFSQIGRRTASGTLSSRQDTISLGGAYNQVFSDKLSGRVEYSYTNNSSTLPGLGLRQHLVLASLRKTF